MNRRPSPAVLRSKELDEFLGGIEPDDKRLKWIADMEAVLKENMLAGEPIKKSRIPALYVRKYGANNLYRYRHPEGYRSCYTIIYREGIGVCPLIIDLIPHSEYEKLFGYGTT